MIRLAVLFCVMIIGAASAQTGPIEQAKRAIESLEQAQESLENAVRRKTRVKALTQTVQAYEDALQALRAGLRGVAIRERTLTLDFETRRDELARLLGVLQSLERAPAPLLLIHPSGPIGTARSGMMLAEITPALQRQAEAVEGQLREIETLKALQTAAIDDLRLGLAGVQEARSALSKAITERTKLPKRFIADPEKVAQLANSAETLKGFISTLRDLPEETASEEAPKFDSLKGALSYPVSGIVLRDFGEPDVAGIERPGLTLATRPIALVTTPMAATIRYVGPFLDYGNVIILEPDVGYLMVLAGLAETFGEVGDILSADDPIGHMGGESRAVKDFLVEATEERGTIAQETLYIELRVEGDAVDPAPWFAQTQR